MAIGIGLILMLVSLIAWGYQLKNGLVVTNMRNSFSWGLYIATFAFFVGIAAGGLIISSSVYLFNIEKLKPLTKLASLSAFACTLGAGAMIFPDLGRIDRVYQMFMHPNFRSPLVWDMIVITTYMILTFLSVYVQLLPDWKRNGQGFLNNWTNNKSQAEVEAWSKRWSRRVSIVGLPVAILIHTVTALIFATQASRGWWNTAILPPDFIAVAVASGTALVLVISLLLVGKESFKEYHDAFKIMTTIVSAFLLVHFFFVAIDLLIHWWWGSHEGQELFHLLFGTYGKIYAIELVLPLITLVLFFSQRGKNSRPAMFLGSVLLFIGVFIHRLMLMFPAFNSIPLNLSLPGTGIEGWAYPVASGQFGEGLNVFVNSWSYTPTMLEWLVALLPFGLIILVVALATRLYSFLPLRK